MKNKFLKIFAIATLFAMAGITITEAGICGKNKEWRKGKCRTKKKDTSNKKDVIQQNFEPAEKFAGQGLVGVYMEEKNTAKIIDPAHDNAVMYNFNNVVAVESPDESKKISKNHVEIGSYMVSNKCAPGVMCTAVMNNIRLFGIMPEAPVDPRPEAPNMGSHTAVMYQIYNNTDQDVELSFLPEYVPSNVRMIPQKETVKAHESILIPQGINRIMLQQSVQQTIELKPFTSYTLVEDDKGNVSFKAQ